MAHHDKRFDPAKATKLMAAERYDKLQPEKLIDSLEIGETNSVADLGAGSGFFTIPMAERTKDTVYAIDIAPQMLEFLKDNALRNNTTNIAYIESNLDKIPLEDASVDRVMAAFVMHEVDDLEQTLLEIKRILKPNGKLGIVEFEAIESESGPPLAIRISRDKLADLLNRNFGDINIEAINQINYLAVASKK
ncbi:SAM-dependent methyltransferase [Paraliobacillus quinghaiensis]|uniref:SAM-dependent methyltransferase n=1 Tax=Paraliobacillus quinghaiensis TaxID=470815 RepID=A0A917TEH6_9BACI|nr:class I SAM-dependent methyltransferase [Paraliobacillus quinghaiensis]GGM19386.1 SAM-dependent methyltransferase [Paraliobacillus quinghaiensis]